MKAITILAASALAVAASAACADDYPARKPGLWHLTLASGNPNLPPNTAQLCIDKATDEALRSFGTSTTAAMCSKAQVRVTGSVVTSDMTCKFGASQQTTHSVTTFAGNAAYHMQIDAHFDPPLHGKSDSVTTEDAKWTGACPADMRPGDIVTAVGMRMNVADMVASKP